MSKKPGAKTVGIVLRMLPDAEQAKALWAIARVTTFAENAIWMEWLRRDPATAVDIIEARKIKEETGKWPKLTEYKKMDRSPIAKSATKLAGTLCPGLLSYVYDGIANQVGKLYHKQRFGILSFSRRLPLADEPRIRFRERAVTVVRDQRREDWYRLRLGLVKGEPLDIAVKTRGHSPATMEWLAELADSGANPSGGCISARRRRGKWQWQISVSRTRRNGERKQVRDLVDGRHLLLYAPQDQSAFMFGDVVPGGNGCPWRIRVEGHDLLAVKRADQGRRETQGRCYAQSQSGGSVGHGRKRAIAGKLRFSERYERRVNAWIEQRSAYVVQSAVRFRCQGIVIEDLQQREPEKLLLGSFPYYRWTQRVEQKATEAGLKVSVADDFARVAAEISAVADKDCNVTGE